MKKNEIACFVFLSLCILGIVFWFLSNISKQEKKPLKQVDRDNTMKQKKIRMWERGLLGIYQKNHSPDHHLRSTKKRIKRQKMFCPKFQ